MLASAVSFVTWLLGLLFGPRQPSAVDLSASNATAQTELSQEESTNANLAQSAAARAAADAAVLHIVTKPGATDTTISADLKQQFPDAYR